MLSQITKGFDDVPSEVAQLFKVKFNPQQALALASKLGKSTTSYNHQMLGGRLLIYTTTRSCKNTLDYLKAYSHRLNQPTINFMQEYHEQLDRAMNRNFNREFDQYDFFSAGCVVGQYLLKTSFDEEPLESIQMMHMRQAVQLYGCGPRRRDINRVLQCYEEMSAQWYTMASPTIFNAGTKLHQLSSCFCLMVGDDMDSISGSVPIMSSISKLNGGIGICVSALRHSQIGDVGRSEGPNGFLSIFDKTIGKVSQGGKRNGAGTSFLNDWHLDFSEFVKLTDNFSDHSQRLSDLNTAAWIHNYFFVRVGNAIEADNAIKRGEIPDPNVKTHWTMFCPKKASSLMNVYGIKFEREYIKTEALALEREGIYHTAIATVKQLHAELLTNPDDNDVRQKYLEARAAKTKASKERIDHKVINAYELYKSITKIQKNSGMPYTLFADPVNYKSNQKSDGMIHQSNLCLEIMQHTAAGSKNCPPKIASCNLGGMNLTNYVTKSINWKKNDSYSTPQEAIPVLRDSYDFDFLGEKIRSMVENLNQVIDNNYYPLDEHDDDGNIVKEGPISILNKITRPLGIGDSGQFDALALLDCTYEGNVAIMFNKMVYACQYWHANLASLALAVRDGAYSTFKTGSYSRFIGPPGTKLYPAQEDSPIADEDGMVTVDGSPISNGQFQFDLWQEEFAMLKYHNRVNERIACPEDNIPVEPVSWGQITMYIYVIPLQSRRFNNDLNFDITSIRRQTRDREIEIVVEPTWDSLRQAIMKYGIRNSLLFAIMPTASSANILRNTESTEAHQSNIYSRDLKTGNYTILVRHLVHDLTKIGLWSQNLAEFIAVCSGSVQLIHHYIKDHPSEFNALAFELNSAGDTVLRTDIEERLHFIMRKYKTMYEISQKFCLKLARDRGIYICQSQSTNIISKDPNLEACISYANKIGLKTGNYYIRQDVAKSTGLFTISAAMLKYKMELDAKLNGKDELKEDVSVRIVIPEAIKQFPLESVQSMVLKGDTSPPTSPPPKVSMCSLKKKGECLECSS